MRVIPFIYDDVDDLYANSFIVIDNNDCIVVDPSRDYDGLVNYINKNQLNLKAILLTHAHFDHIRGVDRLVKAFNAPVYIGFYEADSLADPHKNLSFYMSGLPVYFDKEVETVSDKQELHILSEPIIVLETPYHTMGSVCYYLEDSKILFSGDSLFKNSIGRDDLVTSIPYKKNSSLAKLMALPEDTKVYPGHGPFTMIGEEKKYNPFVK